MGRALFDAVAARGGFEITASAGRAGIDAGAFGKAGAVIDFSTPEGTLAALGVLSTLPASTAFVTGTTGLTPDQQSAIEAAARRRPVVQAGNFSVGVALLAGLAEIAARRLDEAWDIEIAETHHRRKLDAPSGTALALAAAAARGRGTSLDAAAGLDRTGARPAGSIGFSVSRAGGVVGEHAVSFTSDRERVALSHTAFDRGIFAEGALHAARWAHGRAPGLYSMADVLDLKF